ncbi:MAG TPA: heme ABC transporter permease [Alphaproteobacteria bacterium]|nr:heme ABC transporter permease [Alphaproteobacteria bacterium]
MKAFANPTRFLALVRWVMPVMSVLSVALLAAGLWLAFFASPADYQQGETVRIMYIHVPAAWMALFIYTSMAVTAFVGLVWKHVVAELYARAAAPLGAGFTLICLVTGALWGQPMWGTWWAWDARMTSVLVLFFLYLGYIALSDAFDDPQKGINAGAVLLLVGVINVPIIKFSVDWWNTLHQPASVTRMAMPAIDGSMLWPLGIMAVAFNVLFIALVCLRLRTEIYQRRLAVRQMQQVEQAA